MDKLYFGTAGIPLIVKKRSTENGLKMVKELELDAMELEFVRRINISPEKAVEIKKLAEKLDVKLTVHAEYYINLNAVGEKLEKSIERLVNAAKIAYLSGAWSVCFHPGYYMGKTADETYRNIKNALKKVLEILNSENINVWIRPEITGKPSQFGSLEEIVRLSQELDNVLPVIDYAHLYARTGGKYNSYREFKDILNYIERNLGRTALDNMHIHVSGIEFGEKGEKKHLNLKESKLNYKALLRSWRKYDIKGIVISESPNIEKDAILLKKHYYRKRKRG